MSAYAFENVGRNYTLRNHFRIGRPVPSVPNRSVHPRDENLREFPAWQASELDLSVKIVFAGQVAFGQAL